VQDALTDAVATRETALPRGVASLRAALVDDAASAAYRWVYRPMLALQLALYAKAMVLFLWRPSFELVGGAADPQLHQNHLGNYSILNGQPHPALLAVHLTMALSWVGAVLFQKRTVAQMATALGSGRGAALDPRAYARARMRHAVVGTALVVLALAGCIAGPVIAFQSHGHPPMRIFLMLLPLYFLPAVTTVWATARRKSRPIRDHGAWANTAFLAPAVASLWAEALIYLCGRHTPLGPRVGELTGTGLAWALILAIVVIPTWLARRRAIAAGR
jgi:hypothetical protein